jgi:hypothetical protein
MTDNTQRIDTVEIHGEIRHEMDKDTGERVTIRGISNFDFNGYYLKLGLTPENNPGKHSIRTVNNRGKIFYNKTVFIKKKNNKYSAYVTNNPRMASVIETCLNKSTNVNKSLDLLFDYVEISKDGYIRVRSIHNRPGMPNSIDHLLLDRQGLPKSLDNFQSNNRDSYRKRERSPTPRKRVDSRSYRERSPTPRKRANSRSYRERSPTPRKRERSMSPYSYTHKKYKSEIVNTTTQPIAPVTICNCYECVQKSLMNIQYPQIQPFYYLPPTQNMNQFY